MEEYELTVCSSTYFDKKYLELNDNLIKALNPDIKYVWIVIDNNPPSSDEYMNLFLPNLHVYKGDYFDTTRIRANSYHHGNALNKAIRLAKTRFALILDPDFYILRKNWIGVIIEYMKTNNLAFFGSPWNPKWYSKYRYFPCVHCMFIDLEQVDKDTLDFRPSQEDYTVIKDSLLLSKIIKLSGINIIKHQYNRRSIEKSQDTGYNVYYQYFHNKRVKNECVIPVNKNPQGFISHIIDKILPDRFSFNPKRSGYYSQSGFQELGYVDVRQYGWEEYLWKNEPFSFHLRGAKKSTFDTELEIINFGRIINNLTGLEISDNI